MLLNIEKVLILKSVSIFSSALQAKLIELVALDPEPRTATINVVCDCIRENLG